MVFLLAVILGVCVILIVSITLNHKWSTVQIYTETTTSHPVVMNEMTMAGDNYHFRLVCLIHFGFHTISVWVPVTRQQWQELILHWYHFHWYGYNSVSQVTIKACIVLPSVWLESEKLRSIIVYGFTSDVYCTEYYWHIYTHSLHQMYIIQNITDTYTPIAYIRCILYRILLTHIHP